MVSIVLLTTEEVLQRNGYWFRLDTLWVTEELEPFEEVKPEHVCIKPLTRDFYYAKYPDITRSESEDENSMSLNGFRMKHDEWKTKIKIKKFIASRRSSCNSRFSVSVVETRSSESLSNDTRRVTSLVDQTSVRKSGNELKSNTNDDKVKDFFNRLLASVPPPPIEDLDDESKANSIIMPPRTENFNEINLPEYAEFENSKLLQASSEQSLLPKTSTLKIAKHRVSFNFNNESEDRDSWHESIYGLSDLVAPTNSEHRSMSSACSMASFPSWSEIINECGLDNSIVRSKESLRSTEEILSRSHRNFKIEDIHNEQSDDEDAYAKFAIYKIYNTIKTNKGMIDSSSMKDLGEVNEDEKFNNMIDASQLLNMYSLVPTSVDEIDELVNTEPAIESTIL